MITDWDLLKATQETLQEHINEALVGNNNLQRIRELEAELDAVRGLVEKWRRGRLFTDEGGPRASGYGSALTSCADELELALRGEE